LYIYNIFVRIEMKINAIYPYESPSIDLVELDEMPLICTSGDASNGNYTEVIIDLGDE